MILGIKSVKASISIFGLSSGYLRDVRRAEGGRSWWMVLLVFAHHIEIPNDAAMC